MTGGQYARTLYLACTRHKCTQLQYICTPANYSTLGLNGRHAPNLHQRYMLLREMQPDYLTRHFTHLAECSQDNQVYTSNSATSQLSSRHIEATYVACFLALYSPQP